MTTYGWRQDETLTIPASSNNRFTLVSSARPTLEKLSIWALGGATPLTGLTFQVQINGVNFGAAVAFAGPGVLALPVYQDVTGAVSENLLIPPADGDLLTGGKPLEFSVLITSTHGSPQTVRMVASAVGHAV